MFFEIKQKKTDQFLDKHLFYVPIFLFRWLLALPNINHFFISQNMQFEPFWHSIRKTFNNNNYEGIL